MTRSLDRLGAAGALLAAVAAPCCFPVFAAFAAATGLGVLGRFESTVLYLFQGFALVAVVGLAVSYRGHRRIGPLALGIISAAALGFVFYYAWSVPLLYTSLFGLLAASGWNWFAGRTQVRSRLVLQSTITCPQCGHRSKEIMPTNACLFFYDCPACRARLKPKTGHCCVFCSYGSVPCPPIQVGESCCA